MRRRATPGAGTPGLLVTSFLPGTRLDLLLPGLDDARRATRRRRTSGVLLARLATMPMPRAGLFVDGDLRVEPLPGRRPGRVRRGPPGRHRARGLVAPTSTTGCSTSRTGPRRCLDAVRRTCLVHSDLNPKNLLVDPDTLEVTGLLDWEFAHAGLPGHRPGQPAALRARPGLRGRGAGDVPRAAVVDAADDAARPGPGGRPVGAGGPGRPPRREPGHRAGARPAARRSRRAGTCTPTG